MPPKRKEKYGVLLVDDSDDDRLFMRRILRVNPRFVVVGEAIDGEDAIAYLGGKGEFENRRAHPFPDVVLLDLKMPRVTGHEVLEWLRTQSIDGLFVAVVSGSFLPEDVARSMELGADAYYKKDALKQRLEAMVLEIEALLDRA
jgi:CheY-like chemotaxis protein